MEVRCCCDAHLIGWIDGDFKEGESYEFPIGGSTVAINPAERKDVITLEAARVEGIVIEPLDIPDTITIPGVLISGMSIGLAQRVALKSKDYPIEQMRQIPGFREATPENVAASHVSQVFRCPSPRWTPNGRAVPINQ